jgi:hypothetical protein
MLMVIVFIIHYVKDAMDGELDFYVDKNHDYFKDIDEVTEL